MAVAVTEQPEQAAESDAGSGGTPDTAAEPEETPQDSAHRPREGDLPPLDDAAYEAHVRMVEERLDAAEQAGMSTDGLYTRDPDRRVWTKARADQQAEIMDDIQAANADVPCEGKAVIAGGIAGAGKTTVLERFAGIDTSRHLTINPDTVKEEMAERGMIPKVDGLSPMECSQLVHEESSLVAGDLAKRVYAERRNVVWDITMSRIESVANRIDDLRKSGYTEIVGVFVDIPPETSVERATNRHRHGMEEYRNDRGQGGRHLNPDLTWRQQTADGQTANRKVFEALKPYFDHWMIFDNSVGGREPMLIARSDDREHR